MSFNSYSHCIRNMVIVGRSDQEIIGIYECGCCMTERVNTVWMLTFYLVLTVAISVLIVNGYNMFEFEVNSSVIFSPSLLRQQCTSRVRILR